jgi:UDP-glucuronate 4-epimerase
MQPGDVPLTWADVSKAERMLGYRPATRIEEGLKRFVAWYRTTSPLPA